MVVEPKTGVLDGPGSGWEEAELCSRGMAREG